MSQAGRIAGNNLYATFGGTVITGDQTSFSVNDEGDLVEATAGSDTFHYFLTINRRNGTIDFEMFYDGSTTTVWTAIAPNASGTLIIGPKGTASGSPKWTWSNALVQSRAVEFPFDDAVTVSGTFQCNAVVSETTW